ncbi:DUF6247 family protein [Streptomyces mirabilis]|uniref:DUF6247 family protein n=1 Tax=Streptomyces mirabilis TaxID=68239 RepID=UPI0033D9E32E
MSAQPDHAPVPPAPPAPTAAAQVLAQLRISDRADTWVPAFQQDWARGLEDSRHSYSLSPLHDVVRTWQARLEAAPHSSCNRAMAALRSASCCALSA